MTGWRSRRETAPRRRIRQNDRVEIALLLVALAVGVLAVTALADRLGLPGTAGADRGRRRRRRTCRACRRSTSSPRWCCSACCRRCCTPRRSRARWSTSTPTGGRSCCSRSAWSRSPPSASACSCTRSLPGIDWAAAFAIGAVVAPPDAVAATAIGRRIGLPRRVVTILEGESLLNDATALVALRTAIAVIAVGSAGVALAGRPRTSSWAAVGGILRRGRWSSWWSPGCASASPTRCSTPASRS